MQRTPDGCKHQQEDRPGDGDPCNGSRGEHVAPAAARPVAHTRTTRVLRRASPGRGAEISSEQQVDCSI